MKKIYRLLFVVLAFVFLALPIKAEYEPVVGENINVTMKVDEDGQIHVKTVLDVYFNELRHGIYVSLPQRYDMEFNSQKKVYYFPITNISGKGHDMSIDSNRSGVVLRFGSESEQVQGPVRYEYEYTVNTMDLDLDGLQMLYFNIVGQDWDFPINSVNFQIEMPKSFGDEIYFYAKDSVEYTRNGNVITGSYQSPLDRSALTVEIPLENDYFVFPETDFTWIALLGGGVISTLIAVVFMRFGRDPEVTPSVEFEPPEGLSSAEIGYVYRGMTLQKDVVSLIIYWASKGYLIIEELEGDEILLTKRKDLEGTQPNEERRVFSALFKDRDQVSTKELNNKFANTVNHAITAIPKRFTSDPEMRVFNRTASAMKVLMCILAPLIPAAYFATAAYAGTSNPIDLTLFGAIGFGVFVMITIGGSFLVAYDRVHKPSQRIVNGLILIALVSLASIVITLLTPKVNLSLNLVFMIILYLIAMFAAANTGKRTELGARWVGQILGLRNFIELAEKDRLEALVAESPEIFYDVLPYAYVLGVTDVWSKKFESIAIAQPDWYVSSNPNFSTYLLWSSLNRSMMTVTTSMVSVPTPTGSSGGGGSFGGGGGGGFSGGGFGGGGGGSW